MERSLLKEVNKKSMSARISTHGMKPMFFPNFFGTKRRASLKWEALLGSKGIPVKADIIAWDASGGEKTRKTIQKASGDIPKTHIKRSMNESTWNEYKQLSNDASVEEKQILDLVFEDTDFCFTGVRAEMEFLCMQIMSKAELSLNKQNNNGVVTETAVDFGVPAVNKSGVSVLWSVAATATPIADIQAIVDKAETDGVVLQYVIMRKSDFRKLMAAKETIDRIKGWKGLSGKLTLNKELLNAYLEDEMGVKIVVVNPSVKHEDNSTHAQTTLSPWEEGRILFTPDLSIGDIQHGPIAAEESETLRKKAVLVKNDFILTTKWSELEPFKEWTKSEANAFPVLNDPEVLYYLDVAHAKWGTDE